jgi:hypothetical protein
MRIRLFRGGRMAPGCYIVARERDGTFDPASERDTVLVQTDYDFPGVASSFGWSIAYDGGLCCEHDGTDGTVDCPECGRSAGAFIGAASEWLDYHDGAEVEDPGYFAESGAQGALAS